MKRVRITQALGHDANQRWDTVRLPRQPGHLVQRGAGHQPSSHAGFSPVTGCLSYLVARVRTIVGAHTAGLRTAWSPPSPSVAPGMAPDELPATGEGASMCRDRR